MKTDILLTALEFANQGISVVPVATDGSKRPGIASWKQYQQTRPTTAELMTWFADAQGVGVICGKVSGNLEMLELEGRAVADKMHLDLKDMATNAGLGEIWERINNGYVEITPSGGLHWLYRLEGDVPGNTKLARKPGENGGIDVLAETRGEGGFVIVAPTNGTCHPSGGAWTILVGSAKTIPTLTVKEREALHQLFITFDLIPKVEFIREQLAPKGDTSTPGNDYNSKVTWDEILEPLGWKKIYTNKAGVTSWRRPGKNEGGISATTNHAGNDKFYVFSSSTQFEAQRSYSKFAIYTLVEHRGDFTASARALRSQGYGAAIELPSLGQSALAEAMSVPVKTALEIELDKQRTRREAAAIIKEEEASKTYKEPIFVRSLADELKLPEIEAQWVIRDIFPQGANISITAQYKAGKTTLINDLARSLADGTKFLDYFQEPVHSRRIVIFNYEVSANQYRRWMKDVAVKHSDDITLVHLRGERLPMISEKVQRLMISILKDLDCQTWILDPFARAFVGSGDENSNSDVSLFLDTLDYIKKQANIDNLVLPMHTGRAQEHGIERARGATRLDDWADVRWLLSKTEEGRFFAADGRDVFLEQQALAFDEATRSLKLGGASAKVAKKMAMEDAFVEMIKQHPGSTTNEVFELMNIDPTSKPMRAAMKSALHYKRVKVKAIGTAKVWYPIEYIESLKEG